MSLDVYLTTKEPVVPKRQDRIFIREDGSTKEISREEWDRRNPGREPLVLCDEGKADEVFTANITHNLGKMADAAGIYEALWRPDEVGITVASQLIAPLEAGLARLRAEPEKFMEHNPDNGWGSYEGLVGFVERYLDACRNYPEADVSVWR